MIENALYQWFCNWLNGMDFENMSEMQRARIASAIYSRINAMLCQVDGIAYMGSNQVLNLDFPTPDHVFFQ